MRRMKYAVTVLLLLMLASCSGRDQYEPFPPLSKVTVSPEREAAVQSALNGDYTLPPTVPVVAPTDEPFELPSFDEDSFFAEVEPTERVVVIPTDPAPFEPTNTPTPLPPTATPIPPEPTAVNPYGTTENGLTTYTLQQGEDLVCIGRRFNISLSQLLSQNGLTSPDEAGAGTVLTLPRNSSGWSVLDGYGNRAKVRHPAAYTVEPGDTMFSIACYYGDVRPEDIASRNGLLFGEELSVGMKLSIP